MVLNLHHTTIVRAKKVLLVRFCVILLSEPKAPEVFSNPLAPEPTEEEEEEDDYSGYVLTVWLLDTGLS